MLDKETVVIDKRGDAVISTGWTVTSIEPRCSRRTGGAQFLFGSFGGAMKAVQDSYLFRSLAAQHAAVEVWPDDKFAADGWSYFWIVSRLGSGNVRNLAYVRLRGLQFEQRRYDEAGDDLWVAVE
jgi:hypothetical protein